MWYWYLDTTVKCCWSIEKIKLWPTLPVLYKSSMDSAHLSIFMQSFDFSVVETLRHSQGAPKGNEYPISNPLSIQWPSIKQEGDVALFIPNKIEPICEIWLQCYKAFIFLTTYICIRNIVQYAFIKTNIPSVYDYAKYKAVSLWYHQSQRHKIHYIIYMTHALA